MFAEHKNEIGLRRLRLRAMKFVAEEFFVATAAQIAFSARSQGGVRVTRPFTLGMR